MLTNEPQSHRLSRPLLVAAALLLWTGGSTTAQPPTQEEPGGSRQSAAQPETDFDEVAREAAAAREAGRLPEAVDLYRRALELREYWLEGWWYLSTLLYDLDRYPEARDAFRRFVTFEPSDGAGWALLGLCEFQVREYERALVSLQRGQELGLGSHVQLSYVTRYHTALLLTRFEQYEAAISILHQIALNRPDNPKVIEALGLSVLRLPYLPVELPPDHREAVTLAGQAGVYWSLNRLDDAAAHYNQLVERYPEMPNVHYARAVFFLQYDPESALPEFKKELEISPSHVPARLQMAFEYIKRGEPGSGLPFAQEAVSLHPKSFAARNALGRILLATGEVERAIEELEKGVELAPDSPQMYFALARAYTKAGRQEDAKRARAEFLRLDKIRQEKEKRQSPAATQTPGLSSEKSRDPN